MNKPSQQRLDTSHTWDEMHAFVTHVQEPLSAIMAFSSSGRAQIHYVSKDGAVAAQAICTLSRGWIYGLPHGVAPGEAAAAAAGASWNG
jgi:hypothetical protein